jgi:CHAT domain-containing protein
MDNDTRVTRNEGKAVAKGKTRSADSDEIDVDSMQMTRSGRETGVVGAEAGFGRLLSTRREAAAISALVPERERMQALDFEASRTTALKPELGEYRIVHFATHGMLNNIHPELSGLVLSLVDESGRRQDGFLRLQDIYNLKLPADLVVLSACRTGLGKEIKGEGLIGLTRGFMYAGAPRIVASLWKVDDRATSELMKRFYQGMLGPEALRPAGALRQAQTSIWKENRWREPYYWAAFVLQGEWK